MMDIFNALSPFLTAGATIAVAIISGAFMYYAGRPKARSDVQSILNDGFNKLITDLQDERNQLKQIVKEQGQQITMLEGNLRNRQQEIDSLRRFIDRSSERNAQ
jgi:uncharacterized protein HemX